MYQILEKRELAEGIFLMRVHAPRVAQAALPGQFVIVRTDEFAERIPLTIADYDPREGWVTIVTQAIGVSTRRICSLGAGRQSGRLRPAPSDAPRNSYTRSPRPCATNVSSS